jgi:hypothetical protein
MGPGVLFFGVVHQKLQGFFAGPKLEPDPSRSLESAFRLYYFEALDSDDRRIQGFKKKFLEIYAGLIKEPE